MQKVKLFNRGKHEASMRKLRVRKAPNYIIEAYLNGYVKVVNTYYTEQQLKRLGRPSILLEGMDQDIIELTKTEEGKEKKFLNEALSKRDLDFLKAFYQVTNLDIFAGGKLPPKAGDLLKQTTARNLRVKDIVKKLN